MVMTLKPVEVWVPLTELPTLVQQKSKQTDLDDRPKPMALPINDLILLYIILCKIIRNFVKWLNLEISISIWQKKKSTY